MARKTAQFTVTTEGRDKGKVFILTEMSAAQAESWATRAILALMKSNPDLPDGFERMGMAGVAQIGLKMLSGLSHEALVPLGNELMSCVQYQPLGSAIVRPIGHGGAEDDIEEFWTIITLKKEVLSLHLGFFKNAFPWILEMVQAAKERAANLPNTETSPQASEQ